jgi:hypothetical protein
MHATPRTGSTVPALLLGLVKGGALKHWAVCAQCCSVLLLRFLFDDVLALCMWQGQGRGSGDHKVGLAAEIFAALNPIAEHREARRRGTSDPRGNTQSHQRRSMRSHRVGNLN